LMCAYWTNFFAQVSSFSRTASTWKECQTKLESGLLRQFQKQFPSQDKYVFKCHFFSFAFWIDF
jgi:hypothetical protein